MAELKKRFPDRYDDGVVLFDLGASAGLNLVADHLPPIWTRVSTGAPLSVGPLPKILGRYGFDRELVDLNDARSCRRLRAAVWADDLSRLKRLDSAVASARALAKTGEFAVGRASLLEMPLRIGQVMAKLRAPSGAQPALMSRGGDPALVSRGGDPALVMFHSFAADYLAASERESFERLMLSLLSEMPSGSVWFELESGRSHAKPGASGALAELKARVNHAGMIATEVIARASPHPHAIDIDAAALERALG